MRIYVINLDRHAQRWARMENLLQSMDYERIPAVEGANLQGPLSRLRLPKKFEDMTRFERGCVRSHAAAWERLLAGEDSHACILEDDAVLSPDFAEFITDSSWIPKSCDVVKIETSTKTVAVAKRNSSCHDRHLARLYSEHLGSAGYIVSRAGAQKLRVHAARPTRPLDHLLFDIPSVVKNLRVLQLDPALCIQLELANFGEIGAEFRSSIQIDQKPKEKRKLSEKIAWEVTRPWRQIVDFLRKIGTKPRNIDFR